MDRSRSKPLVFPSDPSKVNRLESIWLQRKIRSSPVAAFQALVEQRGNVVRFYRGWRPVVLVNEPAQVARILGSSRYQKTRKRRPVFGNGLVTAEGQEWKTQRELGQRFFKRFIQEDSRSNRRASIVERFLSDLEAHPEQGLFEWVSRLNLQLSFDSLLGMEATLEEETAFLSSLSVLIRAKPTRAQWMNPLSRRGREYRRALNQYQALIHRLLEKVDLGSEKNLGGFLHQGMAGKGVKVPLFDQISTYLLASSDTTASALTSTLHYLAGSTELQGRVREEGEPFVRNLVKEVMRLYPPVWLMSRQATQSDEVEGTEILAGTEVVMLPFLLHRDPIHWNSPERFDPVRFENQAQTPGTYLPFGFGPRTCVGAQLVFQLAGELLGALTRDYSLNRAEQALTPEFHFTLRPTVPPIFLKPH